MADEQKPFVLVGNGLYLVRSQEALISAMKEEAPNNYYSDEDPLLTDKVAAFTEEFQPAYPILVTVMQLNAYNLRYVTVVNLPEDSLLLDAID